MVRVFGYPLKAVIHEKFGDGIMSAISFNATVEKVTPLVLLLGQSEWRED